MPKINTKFLNAEEAKLYQEIRDFKEYSERTMTDRRSNKWLKVWELWTGKIPANSVQFRSRKRLPMARTAVNSFAAYIVGKPPTFTVQPIGDEDYLKAQFGKELLQYQAKHPEILDFSRKAKIWVKSACLFDVGIMKVGWEAKVNGTGVTKDAPTLTNVHTMDFFPDPYFGRMLDQEKVVERLVDSFSNLKNNKAYKFPKDYKPSYVDGTMTNIFDSSFLNTVDMTPTQGSADTQGKVEVWEYWTKDMVYSVADPYGNPVFIRKAKNPYGFLPYVKLDFELEPVPNRFYGYGMIVPNIDLNRGIDQLLNNIIDNINIIINPMYQRRKGSSVDPRQFVSRPGGFIDVESLDGDIRQLQTSDTTRAGFQMLSTLQNMFSQGTRVSPQRAGLSGGSDTATEAEIQQANANVISNAVTENFDQAVSEVGAMVLKLNVQNMDTNTTIRIFNPDLVQQMQDMYDRDFFSPEQVQEALATGTLAGYQLTDEQMMELQETGSIAPEKLSGDEIERIKQYGKLIKLGKKNFDVDADVFVEAGSTIKKDDMIVRKQINDTIQIVANTPNGQQRVDWDEYVKLMADLTGVPGLSKVIVPLPQQPPMMPPEMAPEGPEGPGMAPVNEMNSPQAIRQSLRPQL